jgi:hypothetical protein
VIDTGFLSFAIFAATVLYSSFGHLRASGYLATMALFHAPKDHEAYRAIAEVTMILARR